MTSVDEIRAHLARHADGTVPLTSGQQHLLRRRVERLEVEARLATLRPSVVDVPPAGGPVNKAAKPNQKASQVPAHRPAATTSDRVTAADKAKAMTRLHAQQYRKKAAKQKALSPAAVAAYGMLLFSSADGRATLTTGVIGLSIGRSQPTGSRAVLELVAAGLVEMPESGHRHATTLADALSTFVVHLPPESETDTTSDTTTTV